MKKAVALFAYALLPVIAVYGCAGDGSRLDEMFDVDLCAEPQEPSLAEIQMNIFDQKCGIEPCHTPTGIGPMPLHTTEVSFASLVNIDSQQVPELKRVEPENPNDSYLVWKILGEDPDGEGAIVGVRMPFGGQMLPPEEIDDITQWILNGACR